MPSTVSTADQPQVTVRNIPQEQYNQQVNPQTTQPAAVAGQQGGFMGNLKQHPVIWTAIFGVLTIIIMIYFYNRNKNSVASGAQDSQYGYGTGNSSPDQLWGSQLDADYQQMSQAMDTNTALLQQLVNKLGNPSTSPPPGKPPKPPKTPPPHPGSPPPKHKPRNMLGPFPVGKRPPWGGPSSGPPDSGTPVTGSGQRHPPLIPGSHTHSNKPIRTMPWSSSHGTKISGGHTVINPMGLGASSNYLLPRGTTFQAGSGGRWWYTPPGGRQSLLTGPHGSDMQTWLPETGFWKIMEARPGAGLGASWFWGPKARPLTR